jgi:hypothetical protein
MKKIAAVGISSGIVAVIWTMISFTTGLSTVAGFLAWSSFFAAGGNLEGFKKAMAGNLSGIFWGMLMANLSNLAIPYLGRNGAITLFNGIGSGIICLQSKFSFVSFIPAGFIGWSAYLASEMNFNITIISMIIGSILGFTSEKFTDILLNTWSRKYN